MLPTFLGLGPQRSGSTWLDTQLRSHPAIFLPPQTKEIHFFDTHHNRGIDWYQRFFRAAKPGQCVGEVTPTYIERGDTAERIRRHIPACKFIVVLRNPVDRAFSQYTRAIRDKNEQRTFPDFLEASPKALERGCYSIQLSRYLQLFSREQFLVLIFERVIGDPGGSLARIADFLGVSADGFDPEMRDRNRYESYVVRFPDAYMAARAVGRNFRRRGLHSVVNAAKAVRIPALFGRKRAAPRLDPRIRLHLLDRFEDEIRNVEALIGEDLSLWRAHASEEDGEVGRSSTLDVTLPRGIDRPAGVDPPAG